ncbi:Ig-like domain-containing protein [Luteolibacter soli]|uniref:Ig-like domain-containing protein n=1 Tax=Luteolibacter soli TaxID=3135280 RepID=A0ABU9ATH9_9BACT
MRLLFSLLCLASLPLQAAPPVLSAEPQDQQVEFGDNAVLSVTASGSNLSYQWYKGQSGNLSSPVLGAVGPLMLSLPLAADSSFWVRVSNADGAVNSPAADITVAPMVPATLKGTGFVRNQAVSTPVSLVRDVVRVVGGRYHAHFIKSDGSLWGLGGNSSAQLGDGTSTHRYNPVPVTLTGVMQIAAGDEHTIFLTADGSLWAAGSNNDGQLGDGTGISRGTPKKITGGVARIAAGGYKTFFIRTNGSLWGMGSNYGGELGDGTTIPRYSPVKIADGVVNVTSGGRHAMFIKSDGSLWAMGQNDHGQLGNGNNTVVWQGPVSVATGISRVAAGPVYTLILKQDGTLMGTGYNGSGQLGIGSTTSTTTPSVCTTGVRGISTQQDHCLFLKDDNSLWGMGWNPQGQLGDGTTVTRTLPVPIASGVSGMAAGGSFSYFLDATPQITGQDAPVASLVNDGLVLRVVVAGPGPFSYQWFTGAAGDTTQPIAGAVTSVYAVPAASIGQPHWVRITNAYGSKDSAAVVPANAETQPVVTTQPQPQAVGYGENATFTVAATGTGLGYQWYAGPAGDTSAPVAGATGAMLVTPPLSTLTSFWVRVTNLSGSGDSIAATATVTPATTGRLMGSGDNSWGQLGVPSNTPQPAQVASGILDMTTNVDHGLILTATGELFATGRNYYGQLGDGSTTDRYTPVLIASSVARVATGYSHSLFVKTDGTLWGVGLADGGQLGDGGGYYSRTTPIQVATGVADISCSNYSSQILRTDGTLWQTQVSTDYEVPDWTLVATGVVRARGGWDRYFIKADGSLWGRGYDNYGQIGDGPEVTGETPVLVATGVRKMSAGQYHSLFIKNNGTLWAAGYNFFGQLGDGTTTNRPTAFQLATNVVDAAAGNSHSLFVKTDGTMWSMGYPGSGRLGGNYNSNTTLPGLAATGVSKVVAGSSHSWWMDARAELAGQPADAVILTGQQATLSVLPGGPGPFTYQWFAGETGDQSAPLAGATSSSFQTAPLAVTTKFWLRVGNAYGTANSRTVTVTVAVQPVITIEPDQYSVLTGSQALYSVAATGGALSYQWYRGTPGNTSNPVAGATSPVLGLSALSGAPAVWVRVTNLAGTVDSHGATAMAPLRVPGTVSGMGRNTFGPLADGTTQQRRTPVLSMRDVVKISAGIDHSLFLKADGSLWGSGTSYSGELGTGSSINQNLLPIPIMTGVADMSAGGFTLILKQDGTLWATGTNDYGAHSGAPSAPRFTPVQVNSGVSRIAAGSFHSLVVKNDGSLWAYGGNSDGQLGNGSSSNPGQPVHLADSVVDVAAGSGHSLFLKNDGTLWATGYSQIGSVSISYEPILVARDVVACSAGRQFSHFIKNDRSLWAVGRNEFGMLGTGNKNSQPAPVRVMEDVASVSCGFDHTCIVKLDRTVWTVGRNDQGQLGTGDLTSRSTPVMIAAGVSSSAAGSSQSLFIDLKPLITRQPVSLNAQAGSETSLDLEIHSSVPATIQWYRGRSGDTSRPITGATGSILTLPSPLTGTYYWARVSNEWGWRDSAAAAVTLPGMGSTDWQEWAFNAGLNESNLSPETDADGDGLANVLERAFDTSPLLPSPEGLPVATLAFRNGQTYLDLVYRRSNSGSPDIGYQWSPDLITWSTFYPVSNGGPGSGSLSLLNSNVDGDGSASLYRISRSLRSWETVGFLRLEVTE